MRLYCDFTGRDANKLLLGLILFELCLVLVFAADTSLGSPSLSIKQLFDLDGESSIPAWFSSVQFFLIGLVLLLKSRQPDPDHPPSALFLRLVSAGFIFLSVDEAASIHEKISVLLRHVAWLPRFKDDHGLWVFIYAMIGLFLLLVNYRMLAAMWNHHRQATSIMAIGMGFVLLGGVGLEALSYQFLRSGSTPLLYSIEVALEEFLEMSGASVMLYGAMLLLLHQPIVQNH